MTLGSPVDNVVDGGDAYSQFFNLNPSAVFWDVDGISLQTFAFDIETVGGDRLAPPPLRGSDIVIPYAPGEMWVPKQVGARTISLDMWVVGTNEDGSAPAGSASAAFDRNFRKLRQLLWTPDRQFTLTKRFYVDGVMIVASAKAQYAGGLSPSMTGRTRATFSVDLRISGAYFYGTEKIVTLLTGVQSLAVEGDAVTRSIKFRFEGARKYPKVRNVSLNVDTEYFADLSSGDYVDIDVQNYTSVTDTTLLPPYKSVSEIRHTGDAAWFLLRPGANDIAVSSLTGIGPVVMSYKEAWL